jgi:hypothetical protein
VLCGQRKSENTSIVLGTSLLSHIAVERIVVRASPAATAQVWRHGARQAQMARVLAGVAAPPLGLVIGNAWAPAGRQPHL